MSGNRIESVPQTMLEKLLGSAGSGLGSVSDYMNKVNLSAKIPYTDIGGSIGLGDLMVGGAPDLLNDMSWGKSIFEPTGHGYRIDSRVVDLVDVLGMTGLAAKPAKKLVKGMLDDGFRPRGAIADQGGYIMGASASDANHATLKIAKEMKTKGYTDDQIFEKTLWYRSPIDNEWRWEKAHGKEKFINNNEIRDARIKLEDAAFEDVAHDHGSFIDRIADDPYINELDRVHKGGVAKYNERMIDSPVTESYPVAADQTKIRNVWNDSGTRGGYDRNNNIIKIQARPDNFNDAMKSSARHESQHLISGVENFAKGGSLAGIHRSIRNTIKAKRQKLLEKSDFEFTGKDKAEVKRLTDELNRLGTTEDFKKLDSGNLWDEMYEHYLRLADESQARLVQNRAHMSQAEMDKVENAFYKNYPVAPKDMLVLHKNGTIGGKGPWN